MSDLDRFKVKTKHTFEEISKVVGKDADSALANRMAIEDIDLYHQFVAEGVAHGLIDAPREHPMAEPHRRAQAKAEHEHEVTAQELSARKEFSQQFVHDLLRKDPNTPGPSLSELVKQNGPAWHERLRVAAKSYGELGRTPQVEVKDRRPKPVAKPEPTMSVLWLLPDDVCDANNLPKGSRVSRALHSEMCISHAIEKLTGTQRDLAERQAQMKTQQEQLDALKKQAASDAPTAPPATEEKK